MLDQGMFRYDIVERHHIRVAAPLAVTFAAVRELVLRATPEEACLLPRGLSGVLGEVHGRHQGDKLGNTKPRNL